MTPIAGVDPKLLVKDADAVPFTAYEAQVFVTMRCHCALNNAPMLIRGTDLIVQCPACQARYVVTGVAMREDRRVAASVGRLEPNAQPSLRPLVRGVQ